MTLIDGVGDEVVQFMIVVLIIVIAALAWWSTNANPDRYRTVLVMRTQRPHPVTISIRTNPDTLSDYTLVPTLNEASISGSHLTVTSTHNVPAPSFVLPGGNTTEAPEEPVNETSRSIPLQEMDSIVDADMAMLDNHRMHFYRRVNSALNNSQNVTELTPEETESQEEGEPASNDQIREMDSIVSAMEADVAHDCNLFSRPNNVTEAARQPSTVEKTNTNSSITASTNDGNPVTSDGTTVEEGTSAEGDAAEGNKILIKLKYLNDTLKEVEGSLDELLKDFKWRHFSVELSSECRVRLIFNGRALDDALTLRAAGLHHRAVVHCLVHPKPAHHQASGNASLGVNAPELVAQRAEGLVTEGAPPDRAWDLENIFMTLVSVALTVVWFFRCEYSNMFTASASVALFGLTVFYSVAVFGLYLSDSLHFTRRTNANANANTAPNN